VGEYGDLFSTLDRKVKIYQRKEDDQSTRSMALVLPSMMALNPTSPKPVRKTTDSLKQPLRELTEEALLQHVGPAAALVDGQGVILYLHGPTGKYLKPVTGEVSAYNILIMAHEGLQRDLGLIRK